MFSILWGRWTIRATRWGGRDFFPDNRDIKLEEHQKTQSHHRIVLIPNEDLKHDRKIQSCSPCPPAVTAGVDLEETGKQTACVTPSNGHSGQSWTGLKLGARRCFWVVHKDTGAQGLGLSPDAFPDNISRELERKWNSQDSNWCPNWIPLPQRENQLAKPSSQIQGLLFS